MSNQITWILGAAAALALLIIGAGILYTLMDHKRTDLDHATLFVNNCIRGLTELGLTIANTHEQINGACKCLGHELEDEIETMTETKIIDFPHWALEDERVKKLAAKCFNRSGLELNAG